jgi:hypothetical protein
LLDVILLTHLPDNKNPHHPGWSIGPRLVIAVVKTHANADNDDDDEVVVVSTPER